MKLYTKTGDDGSTGLHGGGHIEKDSPRVEAMGDVDEERGLRQHDPAPRSRQSSFERRRSRSMG
jgi:hypothetical protein